MARKRRRGGSGGAFMYFLLLGLPTILSVSAAMYAPEWYEWEYKGTSLIVVVLAVMGLNIASSLDKASRNTSEGSGNRSVFYLQAFWLVVSLGVAVAASLGIYFNIAELKMIEALGIWFWAIPVLHLFTALYGNDIAIRVARRDFGGSITGEG